MSILFGEHTMSMVNNLGLLGPEINDRDFMIVASVTSVNNGYDHPNIYDASILMPPTELLLAYADGNELVMQNEYPSYLANNKGADDMIIALLTALTKKNVVLYIPPDEYNIFGPALLNYIYFMYGITMCTQHTVFSFNESKLPLLLSKFYMMDLMEPNDYLSSYPANCRLPEFVIYKLSQDIKPFGNTNATFIQYYEYFNNLVRNNNNNNRTEIIRRVQQ